MNDDRPARTRVAPSPTGDPHVGTAYQALFDKAWAARTGGAFVLRIEDTDRVRSRDDSEEAIFRALRWLGLDWDEGPDVGGPHGPYRQSERGAVYREHAERLVASGGAFRCACETPELEERRERHVSWLPGRPHECRDLDPDEVARRAGERGHVVRLRVPPTGTTVVRDELRGEVEFENEGIDEQVLLKSDGHPTYHLANVVDDHLMEITDVIRGEEWLPSLPKHLMLYRAFGWELPRFFHTPLLRNADRSKLSKRRNPTSIDHYREEGILPEALLNFLSTLGWSHPDGIEHFDHEEFVRRFSWDRVSLGGPIFDLEKLSHLNGLWIRRLGVDELLARVVDGGFTRRADADPALLRGALALVQERLVRLADFDEATAFFFEEPAIESPDDMLGKKATREEVSEALEKLAGALPSESDWGGESVEAAVRGVAGESSLKPRDVFMAVRVALTGRRVSTPLFETVELLGRERVLSRLEAARSLLV